MFFQITLGNPDLAARYFVEIKYSVILFRNPFSASGLEPSSMRKNCCEGIYRRKLLNKEKEQRSLPSVTTLMETCFRGI